MCNINGVVFIEPKFGKANKDEKEVIITSVSSGNNQAIRINFSADALTKIGNGIKRMAPAVHPEYRNRMYFYDASKISDIIGFTLSKPTSRGRQSIVVPFSNTAFDIKRTVGEYTLERDKNNHIYIALNTQI